MGEKDSIKNQARLKVLLSIIDSNSYAKGSHGVSMGTQGTKVGVLTRQCSILTKNFVKTLLYTLYFLAFTGTLPNVHAQ